jgi:hypothetical protein
MSNLLPPLAGVGERQEVPEAIQSLSLKRFSFRRKSKKISSVLTKKINADK